jgi:hypothetical protein
MLVNITKWIEITQAAIEKLEDIDEPTSSQENRLSVLEELLAALESAEQDLNQE